MSTLKQPTLKYSEIPMSMVRQVIEHHKTNHTLVKVIETAYMGMPDMTNDVFSVTTSYGVGTPDPYIVFVNRIVIQPTPTDKALMDLYIKYSAECPVHQTIIVTTDTYYTATFTK